MDVRLPDGTVIQNVPDGTSRSDLIGKLQRSGFDTSSLIQQEAGKMALEGMSGPEKFMAGAGKAVSDIGRGAKQLLSFGHAGPSADDVRETRRHDEALMGTGAGMAGNIAGNAAIAVPTAFIPGVNTYTGAALVGGGFGALQPATSMGERAMNAGTGAAFGVAGQGVANGIGRVIKPVQSNLNPEAQRLAQIAQQEGIPLDVAQRTGSKPLQTVNSVLENLPFTAGPEAVKRGAQTTAFNRAVLSKTGVAADLATPDVLAAQKAVLGKTFEDIAGRNSVNVGGTVLNDLSNVVDKASRRLVPDQAQTVSRAVDDILSQVDKSGVLSGTNYQGWRSELGRLSRGNDAQAHYFSEIKKVLDKAFSSQISGADAAAWQQASKQYGNLKTVLDSMGGAGAAPNMGNISPAQLASSLTKQVSREGKALGRGELNDLARVGQTFVRDPIPNSGTPQRMFYQNLMTGAAPALVGGGLGGGIGYATGQDPWKTAGLGAAALYSPRVIQKVLNNPSFSNYLAKGITQPQAVALAKALRAASLPSAMALTANASQQ